MYCNDLYMYKSRNVNEDVAMKQRTTDRYAKHK